MAGAGLLFAACGSEPSPSRIATTGVAPVPVTAAPPTERPMPSRPATDAEQALLATLPVQAGGLTLDGVQIVHESGLLAGHPVDEVLRALDKGRGDAVSVYRYGGNEDIGATTVEGVDGATLLQAFADQWNAPSVIQRVRRHVHGLPAWELWHRGGVRTVIYLQLDVVYLVQTDDPATLEPMLLDMPPE